MPTSLNGIILSAGFSSRINDFKPLLQMPGGKSFICTIAGKLSQVCDKIIIVTGYMHKEVSEHVSESLKDVNYKIVFNPHYNEGMFSSLQAGVKESDSDWILYHFVDQPGLPDDFYSEFILQIDDSYNWIQPVNKGRKGHPVLFNKDVKRLILSGNQSESLKNIGHNKSVVKKYWEFESELIQQDIDTDTDYRLFYNK